MRQTRPSRFSLTRRFMADAYHTCLPEGGVSKETWPNARAYVD